MRTPALKKLPILPRANRRLWRAVTQQTQLSRRVGLLFGLLCLGCSMAGILLVHYAGQHPYFAATQIVFSTDGKLTQDEVQQWGQVALGTNIISLNVRSLEQRLVQHPWIQTAVVSREFPRRLHLTIQERDPIALIRRFEAAYLDGDGGSFSAPLSGVHDLPYISGLERVPLDTQTAQTVLAEVRLCLSLTQEWGIVLSEIHWGGQHGYTVFLSDRQVAIRLGHTLGPSAFALVKRVLETWPPDRQATVFDTRFADQIVASPLPLKSDRRRGVELTRTL